MFTFDRYYIILKPTIVPDRQQADFWTVNITSIIQVTDGGVHCAVKEKWSLILQRHVLSDLFQND